MKFHRAFVQRLTTAAAALAVALLAGAAAADDIEIFFGSDSAVVKPNVLIVVDTSASMNSTGLFGAPYDPAITYSGPCTDPNKVYFKLSGANPTASMCDAVYNSPPVAWQLLSNIKCQAALNAFAAAGKFTGPNVISWWSGSWHVLGNTQGTIECQADDGVHGAADGDAKVYAAKSASGPWTANAADANRFKWGIDLPANAPTLYTVNYMNWYFTVGSVSTSRFTAIKSVLLEIANSVSGVNIGLMQFSRNSRGGMVIYPVSDIDANRAALLAEVNALDVPPSNAGTPLAETLYEAMNYYKGGWVGFGASSVAWRGSPATGAEIAYPSVPASRKPGDPTKYLSPLTVGCQRCVVLLLTDGIPEYDDQADGPINALPGIESCSAAGGDNCLDELAKYLREFDQRSDVPGLQRISTHVVGFAVDSPLLKATAMNGGGKYFTVSNTTALADALTQIVTEVLDVNTSFASPAVSVSAYNRTQHSNDLYYTVFKPSEAPHWDGNVKKYRLARDATGDVVVTDAAGVAAVDTATGYFKDAARSLWSAAGATPDGQEVVLGGAAALLSGTRDVYTWLGSLAALDVSGNAVGEDNLSITAAMTGAASAADRTANLRWAVGQDVNDIDGDGDLTEQRRRLGDPLHSKPAIVTYRANDGSTQPVLYFGTNDGFLHAIDGNDGTELFAFIPSTLLGNLQILRAGTAGKVYGLDGPVTPLLTDGDGDPAVSAAGGEQASLVVGMRRGGRDYYALGVTDPQHPSLQWMIRGGSGQFAELGETWSHATPLKIRLAGQLRTALAFGGGYDPAQEAPANSIDTLGRAVYIVDAETGERLWWAGPEGSGADLELAAMTNSIPADLRVIDLTNDGVADLMYAADTGGRVWRFDFLAEAADAAGLVSGGAIAALGQGGNATPTLAQNRRFYNAPDVTLVRDPTHGSYLAINIGSGYRGHPLNKLIGDMFFSLRDPYVGVVPADYDYGIIVGKLYDATSNAIGQGTAEEQTLALTLLYDTYQGWYLRLTDAGEKSLAEAVTFDEKVMFTTYTPVDVGAGSTACVADPGQSRVYIVSQRTAEPVVQLHDTTALPGADDGGVLDADDRSTVIMHRGIAPEISILFPAAGNGEPEVMVGTEQVPIDLVGTRTVKTFWYQPGR